LLKGKVSDNGTIWERIKWKKDCGACWTNKKKKQRLVKYWTGVELIRKNRGRGEKEGSHGTWVFGREGEKGWTKRKFLRSA